MWIIYTKNIKCFTILWWVLLLLYIYLHVILTKYIKCSFYFIYTSHKHKWDPIFDLTSFFNTPFVPPFWSVLPNGLCPQMTYQYSKQDNRNRNLMQRIWKGLIIGMEFWGTNVFLSWSFSWSVVEIQWTFKIKMWCILWFKVYGLLV